MSAERVILVGAARKSDPDGAMAVSLAELARLTETAGGVVVETVTQRLERFQPGTLIGLGKVEEVAQAARLRRARTVIFDEELSAAQQKALEGRVKAKIIDRTRLILDIFARRARTKEGELQVELAQLSYLLPRLTGAWRGYSQQVGGIGTRGPGERQLEYERRHIRLRIEHLRRDIATLARQREVRRRRRAGVPVPQAAIIGYTNVGKSTLLNSLTAAHSAPAVPGRISRPGAKAPVYADDKLFATLDPTTRRVRLPEGGWAVFTDTVGFIQKLPTPLVAAFRSTLEEVRFADCLVHVMDASSPDRPAQKQAVESVLDDLGAAGIPRVEALNKADLLDQEGLAELARQAPGAVLLSARRRAGLAALMERVQTTLNERWVLRELAVDPRQARVVQEAYRSAQVLAQTFEGGKIQLRMRVTTENWSRLRKVAMARPTMLD